jgi:endonuclease/exonuclease/phosphatase family metal-dependent hydrolase
VKILLIVFIAMHGALSAVPNLLVHREGQPIVRKGVFTSRCIYGEWRSLSDHAPMIYAKERIGTWNISTRVSHRQIANATGVFAGHKFLTSDSGELIDEKGRPVILGHHSEADILPSTTVTNQYYARRIVRIARRIKQFFAEFHLEAMALQEVPFAGQRDVDANILQNVLAFALGPQFEIHYPATKAVKPGAAADKASDVALVVRAGTAIRSPIADDANRMQAYCNQKTRNCVVSVHLLSAPTASDVVNRCNAIKRIVDTLKQKKYGKIFVTGDFNTSAERISRICNSVPGFSPILKTTREKPQSCSTNRGDPSPFNIDLMLIFE